MSLGAILIGIVFLLAFYPLGDQSEVGWRMERHRKQTARLSRTKGNSPAGCKFGGAKVGSQSDGG
jgi:hypothetical protein